jgi:uncharacterized protein YcnI
MKLQARTKVLVAGMFTAGVVLALGGPAAAHVGVDKNEIVAGASTTLSFSISHGCGDSPTTSMRFQIPEGVNNAMPQVHPGWEIEVERAELPEPIESAHGDPITDRPAVISFTAGAGNAVPNGQRDTFSITFTAPETTGALSFPVIQGCEDGVNEWIEAWDGTGTEPESPAPYVMVVAAESEGGGGEVAAPSNGDGGGSSDALAIVGIVVGAVGLVVAVVALTRTRSRGVPTS